MSALWWLVLIVVVIAIIAVVLFVARRARRAGTVLASRASDPTTDRGPVEANRLRSLGSYALVVDEATTSER